LSTGDFARALEAVLGSSAGLSCSVITRLRTSWQDATGGSWAVIGESDEWIHRSKLIGVGVLPLQFPDGQGAD